MVLKMSEGFPPEELAQPSLVEVYQSSFGADPSLDHDPARLVPGTLIRVHTISQDRVNPEVEENGALWILEGMYHPTDETNLFWARAVATGYRYLWYTFEFSLPDEAEAQDG